MKNFGIGEKFLPPKQNININVKSQKYLQLKCKANSGNSWVASLGLTVLLITGVNSEERKTSIEALDLDKKTDRNQRKDNL